MKIMIWKELRENGKWAALALAGLMIAEISALASGKEDLASDSSGVTLCSNTFLMASMFGCVVVGATLGALQILPERRRDQWASLLHRPVSRRVIYLGKVVAGLLLYLLATGLPLLASVMYAASPGQFPAPFLPAMAWPALSDILLGTVFYFAALLAGMHSGKWAGSRGAILLGAIAVLLLHLEGKWPFLLPLTASCILGIAAAGAIDGALQLRTWITRLSLAVVILSGTALAALLVGMGLRATSTQQIYYRSADRLVITTEGQVLRTKFTTGNDQTPTYYDMAGNVVTDERYTGNRGQSSFLSTYEFVDRDVNQDLMSRILTSRSSRRYLEVISANYNGPEIWYRIIGPRSYFVGYDRLSSRCIGICDAEGFKEAHAIPKPFSQEPMGEWYQSPPVLYRIGSRLQSMDFADRRMITLFEAGNDSMYGAVRFPYGGEPQRVAVGLEKEMRILGPNGEPLLTIPYGHDPKVWTGISLTATQDFSRMFLQYAPSSIFGRKDAEKTTHLDVLDAQGQRVETYPTTLPEFAEPTPGFLMRIAGLTDMPVPTLVESWVNRDQTIPYYLQSNFQQVRPWKADFFIPLFAWALLLGGVAVFWARRVGLSARQTAVWVALTLTFGVAGFVGYRLAVDWPTMVRCPQCGRRRSIHTEACPHCEQAWAKPEANGAEIFEGA